MPATSAGTRGSGGRSSRDAPVRDGSRSWPTRCSSATHVGMPERSRCVAAATPPWDDAFTDVHADPMLMWPGRLRLTIVELLVVGRVHGCPRHAICVEPQSGPPDAVNLVELASDLGPAIVTRAPLSHMHWRWTTLGSPPPARLGRGAGPAAAGSAAPRAGDDLGGPPRRLAPARTCASGSRLHPGARPATPRSPGRGRRGTDGRPGRATRGSRSRRSRRAARPGVRPRRHACRAPWPRSPPSGSRGGAAT